VLVATASVAPLAAAAAPYRTCTLDRICSPYDGCLDLEPFTQVLDRVSEEDGGGWIWVADGIDLPGRQVSGTDARALTMLFPAFDLSGDPMMVTLEPNGSVALTVHNQDYDTKEAIALSFFGTCVGLG